jgi:hypothetical protein
MAVGIITDLLGWAGLGGSVALAIVLLYAVFQGHHLMTMFRTLGGWLRLLLLAGAIFALLLGLGIIESVDLGIFRVIV